MKVRVISGVIIGVLLVTVLFFGGLVMAGALCILSMLAYGELSRVFAFDPQVSKRKRHVPNGMEWMGYLCIIGHYALMVLTQDIRFFMVSIFLVLMTDALLYVAYFPEYGAEQLALAVFGFLYAPLMLSFIYMLWLLPQGRLLVWLPFVAWVCDTCAYLTGSAIGRHKLCPGLSPKKTVEGALGGLLGSTLAGVVYGYVLYRAFQQEKSMILTIALIAFAGGLLSQCGDLLASGIKRDYGVKDYGNMIPGHGGVLDRFDSVIFIAPVIYFLSTLIFH